MTSSLGAESSMKRVGDQRLRRPELQPVLAFSLPQLRPIGCRLRPLRLDESGDNIRSTSRARVCALANPRIGRDDSAQNLCPS